MANIQLAKNLLYLRTLYNLKQDDIANLFNITRQACSKYLYAYAPNPNPS